MSAGHPLRLRAARWLLHRWPLPRGRHRAERLLLAGFRHWAASGDVDFRFGRLLDVSLAPWPRGYRELFLHGFMEEDELAVWRAALRPGDLVVDGGANVGYWSMVAAVLTAPGGRVLAFEPTPPTVRALRANLAASGHGAAVQVVERALAEGEGFLDIHVYADDPFRGGASAGLQPGRPLLERVPVASVSLDAALAGEASPALVKLDVEGGELAALRGARGLLEREDAPLLTVEWNVAGAQALGYHPSDLLENLAVCGYSFYEARRGRLLPFSPAGRGDDWIPMVWCLPRGGALRPRLVTLIAEPAG